MHMCTHTHTFSCLAPKLLLAELASAAACDRGSRRAADRGSLEGGRDRGSTDPDRGSSTDADEADSCFSLSFLDLACFTFDVSIVCIVSKKKRLCLYIMHLPLEELGGEEGGRVGGVDGGVVWVE